MSASERRRFICLIEQIVLPAATVGAGALIGVAVIEVIG